jgi:hypothetical protein
MLLTSRENLRIRALNQTAEAVIAASGAAYPTRDARQPASRREQWESAPRPHPLPRRSPSAAAGSLAAHLMITRRGRPCHRDW